MEDRINHGYKIIRSIEVGNTEFVIGHNQNAPQPFVTWKCKNENDYIWGHYTNSFLNAVEDLCQRTLEEVENLKEMEQTEEAVPNFQSGQSNISDDQAWQAYQNYLQQQHGISCSSTPTKTNSQSDFEK